MMPDLEPEERVIALEPLGLAVRGESLAGHQAIADAE